MVHAAVRSLATRRHPDCAAPEGRGRQVTVNLAESPLGWLHARGMISDRQALAGERLRADFERSGLSPRVTMQWDAPPPDGSPRSLRAGDHATVAQLDARRRFDAALADAGPGLSDICWRVICAGEGMARAERGLGWPARSGRLVLTLALDRLAAHYRLPG